MRKQWAIIKNNRCVKSYPYREQCVAWCYMKQLVTTDGRQKILVNNVKIIQIISDEL